MNFEMEKKIYHDQFWKIFFDGFHMLNLDGEWCQAIFENAYSNQRAQIALFKREMDIREYAGFSISIEDAIKIKYSFAIYKQNFDEQRMNK